MAEYRLSPAAEFDLETIWEYTLKQWGEEQAGRYFDLLSAEFTEGAVSYGSASLRSHSAQVSPQPC